MRTEKNQKKHIKGYVTVLVLSLGLTPTQGFADAYEMAAERARQATAEGYKAFREHEKIKQTNVLSRIVQGVGNARIEPCAGTPEPRELAYIRAHRQAQTQCAGPLIQMQSEEHIYDDPRQLWTCGMGRALTVRVEYECRH